jgi:macrophage erythroblast attacher
MLKTHGGMQVPYENYRKIFRTSQRHVERELAAVLTTSNDLANQATDDVLKSMDNMIGRVENLKRKVNIAHPHIDYTHL